MTSNEKITQAVKEVLSDYEPQFDASGWNEMEKMLEGAPKATSFKWTFSLNTVVGTTMLAGGLLAAYLLAGSSKMEVATSNKHRDIPVKEVVQKPVELVPQPITQPTPAPLTEEQVVLNEIITANPVIGEAIKRVEDAEQISKTKKTRKSTAQNKTAQEVNPVETENAHNEYDFMKAQESMQMTKVATFGDQITTRGFESNTDENELLKLKAQSIIEKGYTDQVLSAIKKDSTIASKIIGGGQNEKKQSKRKTSKSSKTEASPQNASIESLPKVD